MSTAASVRTAAYIRQLSLQRAYSKKTTTQSPQGTKIKTDKSSSLPPKTDVPGLSAYVVKQRPEPLGPGASSNGVYKVPEYFCYDRFSYHGAEIELAKYRCPQPSAFKGQY